MARVGRPVSNNPRCMTIPETRVTKGEYWMVQLKAAQYGISVADLIRDAVDQYTVTTPRVQECLSIHEGKRCDGQLMPTIVTQVVDFDIDDHTHSIKVLEVPAQECTACHSVREDVELGATIEECVSDLVDAIINNPKMTLPHSVTYGELLSGKMFFQRPS